MRYRVFSLLLVLGAVTVTGSAQEKLGTNYYPIKVGSKWHYRVGDNQKVVVTVLKAEEFKMPAREEKNQKTGTEKTVAGVVLEIVSGDKTLTEKVAVLPDGVYRFAAAKKDIIPPLRFLKLPPKKGETWTVEGTTNDSSYKGTFTAGEADIVVRGKKYKTITSTSEDFQLGTEKMKLEYYFAEGIGIVKQHVHAGNFNIIMELEK